MLPVGGESTGNGTVVLAVGRPETSRSWPGVPGATGRADGSVSRCSGTEGNREGSADFGRRRREGIPRGSERSVGAVSMARLANEER